MKSVQQFSRAAITNYNRPDGLNNKILFSHSMEDSRVDFFWGLSSWLTDGSHLPVPAQGPPPVYVWVLFSS